MDRSVKILHTAVIQQQLVQRPELVVDYLDAFRRASAKASRTDYDPIYASPLLQKPKPGSIWDWASSGVAGASAIVGAFGGNYSAIGAVGSTGLVALDIYSKSNEADRSNLGRKILASDGAGVMHLIAQSWDYEEDLAKRAIDTSLPDEYRKGAALAGSELEQFRSDNNLPPRNAPPEVLSAYLGTSATDEMIRQAVDRALTKVTPNTDSKGFNEALTAEFKTLGIRAEKIELIAEKLKEYQDKLKEEKDNEKFEQELMQIEAGGRIIGLIVGMNDPVRGKAVSDLFTGISQAAVAYHNLSTSAFALTSLSTGVGGLFLMAGALQAFSADRGPTQTEILLDALQKISEQIARLGAEIRMVRNEVAEVERSLGFRIDDLSVAVVRTWELTSDVLQTVVELNIEEHELEIKEAIIKFENNPKPEHAAEVLDIAYAKATTAALSDITSGRHLSPAKLVSLFVGVNGRIQLLPLEQIPAVIPLCAKSLREFWSELPDGNSLKSEEPRWDRLKLSSGIFSVTAERVDSTDCAVPGLLSICAIGVVKIHQAILREPALRPKQATDAAVKFEDFAGDLTELASWPARAAQTFGTLACVRLALLAYERALSEFLTTVTKTFIRSLQINDEAVSHLCCFFLLNGSRLWSPDGSGNVVPTRYRAQPVLSIDNLAYRMGPGLSVQALRGDDLNLVIRCLWFLGQMRQLSELKSADAYVDRPQAGQGVLKFNSRNPPEAAFGSGNYTEIFYITVRPVSGAGEDVPVAVLRMVDTRRYPVNPRGYAPTNNPPARRGQFAGGIGALPGGDLCPAPWDDSGYLAMSRILEGFRSSPPTHDFFANLEDLKQQGIHFDLCSYLGVGEARSVADAVCIQLEGLAARAFNGVVPLESEVLEKLRVSWLALATTLGARASTNMDIGAYSALVGRCPGLLTEHPSEVINVASPIGWQKLRAGIPSLLGWPLWLSALARGTAQSKIKLSDIVADDFVHARRDMLIDRTPADAEDRAMAGDPKYAMPDVVIGTTVPNASDFGQSFNCSVPVIQLIGQGQVQVRFPQDIPEGGRITTTMLNVLPSWTAAANEYAQLVAFTKLSHDSST